MTRPFPAAGSVVPSKCVDRLSFEFDSTLLERPLETVRSCLSAPVTPPTPKPPDPGFRTSRVLRIGPRNPFVGSASGGRYDASPGCRDELDRLVCIDGDGSLPPRGGGECEWENEGGRRLPNGDEPDAAPETVAWADWLRDEELEASMSPSRSCKTLFARLNGRSVLTFTILL